jgi:predicted RNase H-like nuclease
LKKIRYMGLDLAWAPRNSSGGAVMEPMDDGSVRLVSTAHLRTHEDVLGWIARNRGRHGAIMSVNAPIIVENSGGRRACDELLNQHFARHQIDDHQVNIVAAGHPRTMGRAMMRMGFDPDPQAEGDRVIETFTQPAQVLLFNLERPIRLKHGPIGARKDAVARYRELLSLHLPDAFPALTSSPALRALLERDLGGLNGTRLGELEDKIEATMCAYISAYLDLRGPEDCAFLGDLYEGYVLLPTSAQPAGE